MVDDHLDKETSVSGEITPTGVKASAKSRFVAAVDRLGGNIVELLNAPMEAKTKEKRAVTDARVRAIEEVTSLAIERLRTDPDFAERAMRSHLGKVFERQENKDAVIDKAIEDLRRQPPTEQEASSGPEKIDGAFMNRFERYAEEATTEELREKWGRVLGAEVRRPGTFDGKVLRVIDELDTTTAKLFESVCKFRLQNVIPKCLIGELPFLDLARLVNAGLLIEPGIGQVSTSAETTDGRGVNLWIWPFGPLAVAIPKEPPLVARHAENLTLVLEEGKPALSVYVLTDVGLAISAILEDRSSAIISELSLKLSQAAPKSKVRTYAQPVGADMWIMVHEHPAFDPDDVVG